MIHILLMEPEHPGNIGAIARSMKNFALEHLVLINPACDHLCSEAIARSMHAKDILEKAKVRKTLRGYDHLVGTTGKLGSDYNLPRVPLTPEQLAEKVSDLDARVGILLGREGIGLKNDEIARCDLLVTIPASREYPILNLSHAAAVLFYELFKASGDDKTNSHIAIATRKEKDVIMSQMERILRSTEFSTEEKRETQRIVWKRIFGKAILTRREAFAVIGLLKKIK